MLARLALGLARKLYELADEYWVARGAGHVCNDLECYPAHAYRDIMQFDEQQRSEILLRRRGDGAVFYLNCCLLKDRIELDVHDYTFTRYEKQGVFGDALDQTRYGETIKKLVEICLQSPYADALVLGDQIKDWARGFLPADADGYNELPRIIGRLVASGKCGEYVFLLATGETAKAEMVANFETSGMSLLERIEAETGAIEWLWHENDFDGAMDHFSKIWFEETFGIPGWDSVDDLVARLWLLKGLADVLDSALIRDLALSVYAFSLRAALAVLNLPKAVCVGQTHDRLRAVAAAIANSQSVCLIHLGRTVAAQSFCSWALSERELLSGFGAQTGLVRTEDLAKTLNNMGVCLDANQYYDEALPYLARALEIRTDMYRNGAAQGDHYCAMSHNAIGEHFFRTALRHFREGDLALAKRAYESALEEHEIARKIRAAKKEDARWKPRYAASLHNMAGCHIDLAAICVATGDKGEKEHLEIAKRMLKEALELRVACFSEYPHIYIGGIVATSRQLARANAGLGRPSTLTIQLDAMKQKAEERREEARRKAEAIVVDLGLPTDMVEIELATAEMVKQIREISGKVVPAE